MTFALSEPASDPRDNADRASDEEEITRNIALQRHQWQARHSGESQDIDEEGHVHCLDCPAIIPPKRLASVPDAVRCTACQEAHEHKQQQATGRRR